MTRLLIALVAWYLCTLILAGSVIGLLLFIPYNDYPYYTKSPDQLRSTWKRMGYSLSNKLIERL